MKLLALVPARGGSKRLPGKNIRLLGGRPLIQWSIDIARGLPEITDLLVSTDDPEIAEVSRAAGALVPWLRPDGLATDTATSVDVALHALDWYEQNRGAVDGLLMLQPTSPLRLRQTVERGIATFAAGGGRAVIGVAPAATHPAWTFRIQGDRLFPWSDGAGLALRSQDLPPAYEVTGSFYLVAPADLRRHRTFFTEDAVPLLVDGQRERVDIDTEEDFVLAQTLLALEGKADL